MQLIQRHCGALFHVKRSLVLPLPWEYCARRRMWLRSRRWPWRAWCPATLLRASWARGCWLTAFVRCITAAVDRGASDGHGGENLTRLTDAFEQRLHAESDYRSRSPESRRCRSRSGIAGARDGSGIKGGPWSHKRGRAGEGTEADPGERSDVSGRDDPGGVPRRGSSRGTHACWRRARARGAWCGHRPGRVCLRLNRTDRAGVPALG